jgi:hypothetical protein
LRLGRIAVEALRLKRTQCDHPTTHYPTTIVRSRLSVPSGAESPFDCYPHSFLVNVIWRRSIVSFVREIANRVRIRKRWSIAGSSSGEPVRGHAFGMQY